MIEDIKNIMLNFNAIRNLLNKDIFLWKDFFKFFRKKHEVAFIVDGISTYNTALASIRMRCYDMITFFENNGIKAELYKKSKHYDIVIFTKASSDKSLAYAEKLHKEHIPIIYDAYCDYFDDKTRQHDIHNIVAIVSLASAVITCSEKQKEHFENFHSKVYSISEGIAIDRMKHKKQHGNKNKVVLVYCGYADKAKDTLYIKNIIKELQEKTKCKLLYICQRNPQIKEFKYQYIKYSQRKISWQLCKGDIMIAPRDMAITKNYEHSFTKIGLPMAVGLPVVASPVPAYYNSPAILCETEKEWKTELVKLIENLQYRETKANEGITYVKENYDINIIGSKYIQIIREAMQQ